MKKHNEELVYLLEISGCLARGQKERTLAIVSRMNGALSTAAPESGWRPISTAPKDGREMFVVKAFDVTYPECGVRRYTSDPYCVWPGDEGGWVRWPHPFPPTHWHTLPAAPTAGETL